jgi:hypothetical protein
MIESASDFEAFIDQLQRDNKLTRNQAEQAAIYCGDTPEIVNGFLRVEVDGAALFLKNPFE